MMVKLWLLLVLVIASNISAHQSKIRRSLFEPWIGPQNSPSLSLNPPWSDNINPWENSKITPDLYPSSSKWNVQKPPPVVITKEIRVPVNKIVPVEVAKYIPYPVEKIVPYAVEKIVRIPVDRIVQVPVDRIVRIPIEVPATAAPPMTQMMAMPQVSPIPASAPVAMQTPVSMPIQQQMPLMMRPGVPYAVPLLITAQGLSISTPGLITPQPGMDQIPVQAAAMSPMAQSMVPIMSQQAVASPAMALPSPISNNSTVGISVILNGLAAQRLPQGINNELIYPNALSQIISSPIHGNNIGPDVSLNDYGIIGSLIRHGRFN